MPQNEKQTFAPNTPTERRTLTDLREKPGSTARELVQIQGVDSDSPHLSGTSAMHGQLKRLEKAGLIENTSSDEEDRRYSLTDKGIEQARVNIDGLKYMIEVGQGLLGQVNPDQLSG